MQKVHIIFGNFTDTMKAKRALLSVKIPITVIKNTDNEQDGCQYGIELSERYLFSAVATLREIGISYRVSGI